MFFMFTPYTFLFFSIYLILLFSLIYVGDFYIFWLVMELMMLVFMGMAYTLFSNSFSFLMIYFLVQTVSSFSILVGYLLSFESFILISILLKLGMFPFHNWFINCSRHFPGFILWLSMTLHKLPVFVMYSYFLTHLSSSFILLMSILNFIFLGFTMMNMNEFRTLLVLSSVANNSWFFVSDMVSDFVFFVYFVFYTLFLGLLFYHLGNIINPGLSSNFNNNLVLFLLVIISGMPPFPLFFCKMMVVYFLMITFSMSIYSFLFLLASCFVMIGYYRLLSKYLVYYYI